MPDRADVPEDLAQRLTALRESFRPKLRERLEALLNFAHQMVEGSASAEDAASAKQIAHRVRGTAGSYGFHRAGEIAQTIEAAITSAATSADEWKLLAEKLELTIHQDCRPESVSQ